MQDDKQVYWQQAAGDKDRNYVEICLTWGVILNGPGRFGEWPECQQKMELDGVSSKKRTDIKRFSEEMKDGDIVALRLGTDTCVAVGKIVGHYQWNENFGDIDGWDIQHVRRVSWAWCSVDSPFKFDVYSFKQGDTTQVLTSMTVINWIDSLGLDCKEVVEPIKLPSSAQNSSISIENIFDFLFDNGVASESINFLMQEMDELIRIANWYLRSETPSSEFETIAYLAVPFLRALGWTPQRMAIEWNNVDIALFSKLPRSDENLSVVVEAKKRGNSCLSAASQAKRYAEKYNCSMLIVTDGIRYGIFKKIQENFELQSYLNITRLRKEYPIYECGGAQNAILAMTPEYAPAQQL